jgi:hypothetical protein
MNKLPVFLPDIATFTNENTSSTLDQNQIQKSREIHILSVGSVECGSTVHDALLNGRNFHLTIAINYRMLWAIPKQESFQVAIVHSTLSVFEAEAACRLIRRRWPQAKVLVALEQENSLDRALYNDRVTPNLLPELLFTTILRSQEDGMSGASELQNFNFAATA